jgi:hypothetical protein
MLTQPLGKEEWESSRESLLISYLTLRCRQQGMSESDETMFAKQAPESGPSRKSDTMLGPSGYHVSTSEPHDNIERASEPSRYDEPRRFQVDAPPPRTAGTDCWSCRENLTTSPRTPTSHVGACFTKRNTVRPPQNLSWSGFSIPWHTVMTELSLILVEGLDPRNGQENLIPHKSAHHDPSSHQPP